MIKLISIAEEFGEIIWPVKEKLNVEDLTLFGSLTYGKRNPRDIDMLIIHYNPLLDKFHEEVENKKFKNGQEAFLSLSNSLKSIDLIKLFKETNIEKLIKKDLFQTVYMNIKYFTDEKYKKDWKEKNQKAHTKARLDPLFFEERIFKQGLLWNPLSNKYDIPAKTKYKIH